MARSWGGSGRRRPQGWRVGAVSALAAGLMAGSPAPEAKEAAEPPTVDLDRLLRLPESLELDAAERGGATASQWRLRFQAERAKLSAARAALHSAQVELEGLAEESSSWQMAPPGAKGATQSPVSFRLHQEIRRQNEEIDRSQRRLEELGVEADLAGVPEKWRQ